LKKEVKVNIGWGSKQVKESIKWEEEYRVDQDFAGKKEGTL